MIALSDAWFDFADSLIKGSKREMRALRRLRASDDEEISRGAIQKLAGLEKQLKLTLQDRLYTKEFNAFGVDITLSIDEPEKPIPSALFNFHGDIDFNWLSSEIAVAGKRIVGVRITRNYNGTAADEMGYGARHKNRGGRPPHRGDAYREGCRRVAEAHSNFCSLSHKEAFALVWTEIQADQALSACFGPSASLKTFRPIRNQFCAKETLKTQN